MFKLIAKRNTGEEDLVLEFQHGLVAIRAAKNELKQSTIVATKAIDMNTGEVLFEGKA